MTISEGQAREHPRDLGAVERKTRSDHVLRHAADNGYAQRTVALDVECASVAVHEFMTISG